MRRAFTAIELAVVLIIVFIVAAYLLPALQKGRQQARRTRCLAQLRQIGMACQIYQSSHGGAWPSARRSVDPRDRRAQDATASVAVMYPEYAPKPYLFRCPATDDVVAFSRDARDFLNCENFASGPEAPEVPRPPSYFYDCRVPRQPRSGLVIYGDECVQDYLPDPEDGCWLGQNNHGALAGGNFLYADKHAEWLGLRWTGEPWAEGESDPYVPNPSLLRHRVDLGGHSIPVDTDVFIENWAGRKPEADADLAGMMWVGDRWTEH